MIIVLGSVTVREDVLEEALRLSQEHVSRSRSEQGCINHAVHIDAENQYRLVFVEQWETIEDLELHFQVPASGEFVAALAQLASVAPEMNLYESAEVLRH